MIWRMKIWFMILVEEMLLDIYKHYVNKMKEINKQCEVYMEKHENDKFDQLHIKFNKANDKADKWRSRLIKFSCYIDDELANR